MPSQPDNDSLEDEQRTGLQPKELPAAAQTDRPAKTFWKTFLKKMGITARLMGKEIHQKKLKWFDLRRADYQLGKKAYETQLATSKLNPTIDRIKKIQIKIDTLGNLESSEPPSEQKFKASAKGAGRLMKIQILRFKRNHLFRNLGKELRQRSDTDRSLVTEVNHSKRIEEKINAIDSDVQALAARSYFWARRPLLAVTLTLALVLLLGAIVSVKKTAGGKSNIADQNDLLHEISAAALNTMITEKHYLLSPKEAEIDSELHELELDLNGVTDALGEKALFEKQIAEARARFFSLYPDKPGAAAARSEFSQLLWGKDLWYLTWRYLSGGETSWSQLVTSMTGGEVDGGIPAPARPAFDNWVKAVHQAFLNNHWGQVSDLLAAQERATKAILESESYYATYAITRDFAEFDTAGREPAGFNDPKLYGVLLCARFEGMPWTDAAQQYVAMEQVLGRDKVRQVMQKIHDAPKNAQGDIARAEAVGVTETNLALRRDSYNNLVPNNTNPAPEGAIVVSSLEPLTVAVALIASDDSRRYLLKLMAPKSPALKLRRDRGSGISTQNSRLQFDWNFAATAYQRWGLAFGESAVKDAAEKVRRARKRLSDGEVLDSDALGSVRADPYAAFRDLLIRHNPKGYTRAILSFHINDGSALAIDAAYQKLVAAYGEQAVLAAAKKLSERSNYDPSVWDNFDLLTGALDGSSHPKS